jgi:hypothetical protein
VFGRVEIVNPRQRNSTPDFSASFSEANASGMVSNQNERLSITESRQK